MRAWLGAVRSVVSDTVAGRIWRVAAGVLIAVLAIGTGATIALLVSADQVDRLSGGYGPASDANAAALTAMLDCETGIRGYALNGSRDALAPYRDAVTTVLPSIDAVDAKLHGIGNHSLDPAVATERRAAAVWISTVARPAVRDVRVARRMTQTDHARALFDRFRSANAAVATALMDARSSLRDDTQTLTGVVYPLIVAGVVLAVLVSGFATFRIARGVSRPLAELWNAVRRLESGDLSGRADATAGPAEVRAVSAAVNSLASERGAALRLQLRDDVLRRETRELTSAIRIGQDSRTIARTLVVGLGRVFDADVVWVVTFGDPRVPEIADRWRRAGPIGVDADAGTDLMLHALANRLWHGGTVVGIPDHEAGGSNGIVPVPQLGGSVRSSAVAAIGEGNAAMGLLWLGSAEVREWSSVELGLVQHVAGELAQNLVQNHVLAQQRAAMRQLREADEAKSALVSTVSHELRTPLTSIIGYIAVLLDTYADTLEDDVVSMLRVIERNATRLRGMIEDLLLQSEVEVGRRMERLERTDLAHVLDDVRETITPLATNARLELEIVRPEEGTLIVAGNARELAQAMINLAANAVKFTSEGGSVLVTATHDPAGTLVALRVEDTGMGIPEDEVPHLFERFFRARNARSAVIPGTGLGLSIVADIVSRHAGTVEVESEVGHGTAFVVRLPLSRD